MLANADIFKTLAALKMVELVTASALLVAVAKTIRVVNRRSVVAGTAVSYTFFTNKMEIASAALALITMVDQTVLVGDGITVQT